jgi:hypothetical protein
MTPALMMVTVMGGMAEARRIGKGHQPHSRVGDAESELLPAREAAPADDRPHHVALEDTYSRAHWDEIYALCRPNSMPFNSTRETIQSDAVWKAYSSPVSIFSN